MVALHHALEDDDPKEIKKINDLYRKGQLPLPSPNNPNLPKYYKGKSDKDAYYGYKMINGQTGELIQKLIRCFIGVHDIHKFKISYKNHKIYTKNDKNFIKIILTQNTLNACHCFDCLHTISRKLRNI